MERRDPGKSGLGVSVVGIGCNNFWQPREPQTPQNRRDMSGIKFGYYGGMRNFNPSGMIPLGPELDFSAPHNRRQSAAA